MRKQHLFAAMTVVLVLVVILLAGEGLYAVARLKKPDTSVTYWFVSNLLKDQKRSDAELPADDRLLTISSLDELESMIDDMKANGVGLGNAPYAELKTEAASANIEIDGCWSQRPNIDKTMVLLRSTLFNSFDPMNAFYDTARVLPPRLQQFLDRYAFRKIRHRSNAEGERLTLPSVESPRKVLVTGSSIANGSMVNDWETLASQLQARDDTRQYVNIGVNGAAAKDNVCMLERAERRYAGGIREVVYFFSENDHAPGEPYGRPEELIPFLSEFAKRNALDRLTLVYLPKIYNAAPDVMRVRGHSHWDFPYFREEKRAVLDAARQAGFTVVDFLDATNAAREEAGSPFGGLPLYVNQGHLSPIGTAKLVEMLKAAWKK